MQRSVFYLAIAWIGVFTTSPAGAEDGRYIAAFAGGRRVMGATVEPWARPGDEPLLGGVPLFDPAEELRWLCDREAEPGKSPPAVVEFFSGDRLPGVVVARAGAQAWPAAPACLVVVPAAPLVTSRHEPARIVRVLPGMVRRWWIAESDGPEHGPASPPYRPSTLRTKDGRSLEFRSIRLESAGVTVLHSGGAARIPYEEIAELQLPPPDVWERYFDEIAALCPNYSGPKNSDGEADGPLLCQVETVDGVTATTSTDRYHPLPLNDRHDPGRWFHLIQPAWSLDAFAVPHSRVRLRHYFPPHELPLSHLAPSREKNRSTLHSAWPAQADKNVRGGPLRCGGRVFGWGYGVHGTSELAFPLPPIRSDFRAWIGIDDLAGRGGCARGRIAAGDVLFASEILRDGRPAVGGEIVPLPTEGKIGELKLSSDALDSESPPGAGALDIGDAVNWLEPTLILDRPSLAEAVRRRRFISLAAWSGWTPADDETAAAVTLEGDWFARPQQPAAYRPFVRHSGELTLRKSLPVASAETRLLVATARLPDSGPAVLEVRAEGEVIVRGDVPIRFTGDEEPAPLAAPLGRWAGKSVSVEVAMAPASEGGASIAADWRGLALTDRDAEQERREQDEADLLLLRSIEEQAAPASADDLAGKEAYKLWVELDVMLRENYADDACRLMTSLPTRLLFVPFDAPGDAGMTTLAALIEQELPKRAEVAEHMRRHYGPLGELRLNGAIADGDPQAVAIVAIRFAATPAAARAHAWLGDRALSQGDARGAIARYERSLPLLPAAEREQVVEQLKLAEEAAAASRQRIPARRRSEPFP